MFSEVGSNSENWRTQVVADINFIVRSGHYYTLAVASGVEWTCGGAGLSRTSL